MPSKFENDLLELATAKKWSGLTDKVHDSGPRAEHRVRGQTTVHMKYYQAHCVWDMGLSGKKEEDVPCYNSMIPGSVLF
jgi:hypothetical protein